MSRPILPQEMHVMERLKMNNAYSIESNEQLCEFLDLSCNLFKKECEKSKDILTELENIGREIWIKFLYLHYEVGVF